MPRTIYAAPRIARGMTQERAAERLACSVRSLADYESGARPVPDDICTKMAEIYDAQYLCYQHLRLKSDIAQRLIPEAGTYDLPEAVLQLIDSIYDFADAREDRRLVSIARDGVIDDEERPEFDRIVAKLEQIIKAALSVAYTADGVGSDGRCT